MLVKPKVISYLCACYGSLWLGGGKVENSKTKSEFEDIISFVILIVGLIIAGMVVMIIARLQSGLVGIILAILAVALVIYWIREFRREVTVEEISVRKAEKWTYDLIDSKDSVIVVAEVPGPESEVKVSLIGQKLEIKGGNNFSKVLKVGKVDRISHISYVNGILNVKLIKRGATLTGRDGIGSKRD
jgi:hypothetical protein